MWSRVLWPGRYGAIGHVVEGSLAGGVWSYGSCGRGSCDPGTLRHVFTGNYAGSCSC